MYIFFRFSANPASFASQFASVNAAANDWTDIKFPPGADGSLDSYSDLFIQNAIDNQAQGTKDYFFSLFSFVLRPTRIFKANYAKPDKHCEVNIELL